jgi:hypothetical protein
MCLPTDVWNRLRELCKPELQVPTHVGGIAIRPGAFHQSATGMRVAGFGDGTLPASLTTRILRGDQAQELHQLFGVIETREVAKFRYCGDGHRTLDSTQGLEGLDDGV